MARQAGPNSKRVQNYSDSRFEALFGPDSKRDSNSDTWLASLVQTRNEFRLALTSDWHRLETCFEVCMWWAQILKQNRIMTIDWYRFETRFELFCHVMGPDSKNVSNFDRIPAQIWNQFRTFLVRDGPTF